MTLFSSILLYAFLFCATMIAIILSDYSSLRWNYRWNVKFCHLFGVGSKPHALHRWFLETSPGKRVNLDPRGKLPPREFSRAPESRRNPAHNVDANFLSKVKSTAAIVVARAIFRPTSPREEIKPSRRPITTYVDTCDSTRDVHQSFQERERRGRRERRQRESETS